ncbi:MAG: phosphoenolpyruvate--protein phosphotransferase [Chitinivibrionales bacterium]|nr:phosphoenolpyruvate--protein phosphotransferase [Chitinivibrionales bacterium]
MTKRGFRLNGITVVPGKGLGKAFFVGRAIEQASTVSISRQDVGDQIMRFNEIREKAKGDYRKLLEKAESESSLDASILNIYEHILDDPAFIGQVVETISTKLYDLETSIRLVSSDFIKRFNSAGTSYFRERSGDMVEICEKLIAYVDLDEGRMKEFIEPVVLVVSRTFTPSDILKYNKDMIQAVITTSGGKTSHAAILARSYSIPVVSGISNLSSYIHPGDVVYVDADKGVVQVRPSSSLTGKIGKAPATDAQLEALRKKWDRPVYTRDGIHIEVLANISLPEDVDQATRYCADGIGLVRTEYLLSNRNTFPSEDAQFEYYTTIFQKMKGKHSIVRLMDIGGDKIPEFFDMPFEQNPFMGWRAIRIFLERKEMFKEQLRALIRAGKKHNYSIMVPMVTTLEEWLQAKDVIAETASEMNVTVPQLGVLFEVPLAILEMDTFMKAIDFASIGTNDLIQYLSAADRNNAKVNYLYNPIEPAFLKIIRIAIETANSHGKPVSICGEMAGNPYHTLLLTGLGLRKFSVVPRNIPIVKEIISHINYAEASENVSHAEAIISTNEMQTWLKNLNKRMLGDTLTKLPVTADV